MSVHYEPNMTLARGWVRPPDWQKTLSHRPRSKAPWPKNALLLATAARDEPGEPLAFGACALLPSLLPGQRPVEIQLFFPDGCPESERRRLAAAATGRGLAAPVSRREVAAILRRRCYKQRLPLVGYRLPPQLARIAAGWRPIVGGFSLVLASRPAGTNRTAAEQTRRPLLQNGEIEDGYYPRITLKSLGGERAQISMTGRGGTDSHDRIPEGGSGRPDPNYRYQGRFVDLATIAAVHSGKRFSTIHEACGSFDLPTPPPDPDPVGRVLAELELLALLYIHLLARHQQAPGGAESTIDQLQSPASYADALLRAVGLDLPLAHSDLPEHVHAQGMAAFYGGDCGIAERHSQPAVTYLDIAGHYPVAAHLAGTFELLRSTHLDVHTEDPAELEHLLGSLTTERLLTDRALWPRLAHTICQVQPDGCILIHRVPTRSGLQIKTAPLTNANPHYAVLADLADSILAGSPPPRIVSAFSLRQTPRRRKRLRPYPLSSGHRFDSRSDDLFIALAHERLRTEQNPSLTPTERKQRSQLLKLIVNAACYGLLCQINVTPASGRTELVHPDGTIESIRPPALEEPGRWTHPVAASGVTATGRLLLRLARTLAEQMGGTVCLWDTDSLAVTGLDPHQIRRLQYQLQHLSPYDPSLNVQLLELEPENYSEDGHLVQLRLNAAASKNYDLYSLDADGQPEPRKSSEHGLGHLEPPSRHPDQEWRPNGRNHLLRIRLGLPSRQPAWWHEPQLSILTLNRPTELIRLQAAHPTIPLLPYSQILIAHPSPQYARTQNGQRLTPATPYHSGIDIETATWTDLATAALLTIHIPGQQLQEHDLAVRHQRVVCNTLGAALQRTTTRPETKALDEHGHRCTRTTTGPLTPAPTKATKTQLVGKETRNLERAGITEDPTYTRYTDPDHDVWRTIYLPTLRALAPKLLTTGRPSRTRQAELIPQIADLARATLQAGDPAIPLPADPEQACRLFLRAGHRESRRCGCGCNTPVDGRALYVNAAHRTRAYRRRIIGQIAER